MRARLRPIAAAFAAVAAFAILLAALLLPAPPALAQASASSGNPDREGCWCGYQTNVVRSYVIRGTGSDSTQKEAAADMLREWNRYVNLWSVSVDPTSSLGSQNGVNEVNVFITSQESIARYGIELEPSTFGVAAMFPEAGFGSFNQCKDFNGSGCGPFTETDVVVNANFPTGWTGDWYYKGNDQRGGAALVQATVLHEVGHTLGLHHVFDLAAGAGYGNSLSTMNYLNDDVGKFVTRIDAKTVRTEYPGAARSFVDMAIYPFVYGNKRYDQTYASFSKASVLTGEQLTVSNWLIQNVGPQKAGSFRVTFYVFPAGSRPYPQPSDVAIGTVDFGGGADVNGEKEMDGTPLVVPNGTPQGDYWVGAIVTVSGQEDSTFTAGKPNNNRFVVGHDPFTTLRVLPGAGPTPVAADFKYAPATPQAGQLVSFTDLSRGSPTSFSWSFGDSASGSANTSTQQNPEHTFASAGTYTVTLTVASGTSQNSASRQVVVTPKPGGGGSTATSIVPVVIDLPGRFSSELTLTNSGTTSATVTLRYTSAPLFGGLGSGSVPNVVLGAGRQLRIDNAIEYLRSKGLAIPSGNQGGSLRLEFAGLSNAGAAYASARTTAPIAGVGRAGLSYAGVDAAAAYKEPVAIFGLRENGNDRSNLALVNASTTDPVALTIYVVNGNGVDLVKFDPVTLQPGEWSQYNSILAQASDSFSEGWIIVDPGTSTTPYLAYGVFNDNGTNDGSYVTAIQDSKVDALLGVPAVVEIGDRYSSELMITNLSDQPTQAYFEFIESLANPGGLSTGLFYLDLDPFEQAILPNIVDTLRQVDPASFPLPKGGAYAGSLTVLFAADQSLTPGLAGVRTSSPSTTSSGRYGLFYPGDPFPQSARDAWLYGLQQNTTTRSNLAIVNAGVTNTPITVRMEIVNGDTGALVKRQTLAPLAPLEWTQLDRVLQSYAPGVANAYIRLSVVEGDGSFFAYAVLNDGAEPGQGTSDGSYVSMVVNQ